MGKISTYISDTAIALTDYLLGNKASGPSTQSFQIQELIDLFFANIPAGSIDFTALLSTIFSGQLQSFTNSGTAGGTGYYIDLGGIKIVFGTTSLGAFASGTYYTFNYPIVFDAIPTPLVSPTGSGGLLPEMYLLESSVGTSSFQIYNIQNTYSIFYLIIGT